MQQSGNSHPDAPQRFDPTALTDVPALFTEGFGLLRRSILWWVLLHVCVIIGSIGTAFLISAGLTLVGRIFQFVMPGLFLLGAFRISAAFDGYRSVATPDDVPWASLWLVAAAGGISLCLYLIFIASGPMQAQATVGLGAFIITILQIQASIALLVLAGVAVAWPGVGLLVLPLALMLRRHPGEIVPAGTQVPAFAARFAPALALLWLGMSVTMLGPLAILVVPVIVSLIQVAARRAFWGRIAG
jgi:hypothetical protein